MKYIYLDGAHYRADMISRISDIFPKENTHNFSITCDGIKYTFCERRLEKVSILRDHLVETLAKQ